MVNTFNRYIQQQQPRTQYYQPWNQDYNTSYALGQQHQQHQQQEQLHLQQPIQARTQGWTSYQFQSQQPNNPYRQRYEPPTTQRPALPAPIQPIRQLYGPSTSHQPTTQQRSPFNAAPIQQLALPAPIYKAYMSEATDKQAIYTS